MARESRMLDREDATPEQWKAYEMIRAIDEYAARECEWSGGSWRINLGSPKFDNDELAGLIDALQPAERLDLYLQYSGVADDGLAQLAQLPQLGNLSLGCRITDHAWPCLVQFTGLTGLHFFKSKLTDGPLENLEHLTQLRSLALECKKITDAGIAHLACLPDLEFLDLRETKLTDAGTVHLTGMTKLRDLWISGPGVSADGERRLKEAIPEIDVSWG
jgi:hypothetical protein